MDRGQEQAFRGSMILLVEDEESLAAGLEFNLVEEGFEVIRASDGLEALERFDADRIALVILDLMLPRLDGFEVAERIRQRSSRTPILMLTARSSGIDRIRGLRTGADDYLTKPFHLEELILRVKGMLRRRAWYRQNPDGIDRYSFGANNVDFETLQATAGHRELRLTPLEARLLRYLIANSGRVISREELLDKVWHTATDMETRTVDSFIARLRKYFEPNPARPVHFINVRGAGYMFQYDNSE